MDFPGQVRVELDSVQADLCSEAGQALQTAHNHKVLHCDVSQYNSTGMDGYKISSTGLASNSFWQR